MTLLVEVEKIRREKGSDGKLAITYRKMRCWMEVES